MQSDLAVENFSDVDSLVMHVSNDLASLINHSKNPKSFLKKLSYKLDVHERTLERILNRLNRPSYSTVFKIYRYLLNESDDAKVIENSPSVIKNYLLNANPQRLEKGIQYLSGIDKEIQKNPVFAEIYVLAGTRPLKESEVASRFGTYGLDVLASMSERNILTEKKPGEYVLGPKQTNLSPESVLALGLYMSQSFAKPQQGQEKKLHFMGFLAEGLTEDAYLQWIKIDEDAYNKKLNLSRDPKNLGPKRAFAFSIIETLESKDTP